MARNKLALLVILMALIVIGGCQAKESRGYRDILKSDFGIGVFLGMTPSQVHEELGIPTITTDRQGGASIEEYYLTEDVDSLTDETPYTSFTYQYEKLVRVSNKYFPDHESPDFPLYFPEPLPGVKLGARRSAFVDVLGSVEKGGTGETWRFNGAEGELITVKAWFTDVTAVNDTQCSSLSVSFTTRVENSRGEAFKDKK